MTPCHPNRLTRNTCFSKTYAIRTVQKKSRNTYLVLMRTVGLESVMTTGKIKGNKRGMGRFRRENHKWFDAVGKI